MKNKKILPMILLSTLLLVSCDKNEAPVISGLDNLTYIIGDEAPNYLAGVTATDPEDGDLTSKIYVDVQAVDLNTVGTYEITYLVFDSLGAKALETRTIDVIKVKENEVAEYINNANYQTLVNNATTLNLEVEFDNIVLMTDVLPIGLQFIDAKIALTSEFDLHSYEEANGHFHLDVFIENVNIYTSKETQPWFTLSGYVDMVIDEQTVYIDNQIFMYETSPAEDEDGNPLEYVPIEDREEMGPLSDIFELFKMFMSTKAEEITKIQSYFIPCTEQVEIEFEETKFNMISLALPQLASALTNLVDYQAIKNSSFKFVLGDALTISKSGVVFDTSELNDLNIVSETVIKIIDMINSFEATINNNDYTFNTLGVNATGVAIMLFPIYETDDDGNDNEIVTGFDEQKTNLGVSALISTKDVTVNKDINKEDYEVVESNPLVDLFF